MNASEICKKSKNKKCKNRLKAAPLGQETHTLKEDQETAANCLNKLRSMVLADAKLNCPTDEKFLMVFLRTKDFNTERAFKLLRNYWTMRLTCPDIYAELRISELRHILDEMYQEFSSVRDQNGSRIYYLRPGRWDPKVCSVQDMFRTNLCLLQRLASEPETQKHGIVLIVDLKGLHLNQVRHFTPGYARKTCSIVQDSFPIRFKAIHILNEPWVFSLVVPLLWPILKEKMRRRIFCHGDSLSSLHRLVDKSVLLQSYGGDLPEPEKSYLFNKLTKETHHFDFFEK